MAGDHTFTIIKPVAFRNGHLGKILARIYQAGFTVIALKITQMTEHQAGEFYAMHQGKPFFDNLVGFMSSGPIAVAILKKENAVEDFRRLIGSTNPNEAADGTLRHDFGTSLTANAVHGSDSDKSAELESSFFFSGFERFQP